GAIESKEIEKIRVSSDSLSNILREISTSVYAQAAQQQQGEQQQGSKGDSSEDPSKENVVDADYEVVDEEGKKSEEGEKGEQKEEKEEEKKD
ncbi:MAG: hypothetical protein ACE5KG_04650, partial [Nitrososphaerales archaeon]